MTDQERPPAEVGLREVRQNASDLVRRAENGEYIVITVSGRAAATLGPAPHKRFWLSPADINGLFAMARDEEWALDQAAIDQEITDPWER